MMMKSNKDWIFIKFQMKIFQKLWIMKDKYQINPLIIDIGIILNSNEFKNNYLLDYKIKWN
jgi:hypothetical protein